MKAVSKLFKKSFFGLILILLVSTANSQQIKQVRITELDSIIKASSTPLIISFWATWCAPCIEEIPWFSAAIKKAGNEARLLLVSVDGEKAYPDKLREFVNKNNITAPVFWLNETDADYFCPFIDKAWSGSIPATLFVNNKSGYRKFFEKQLKQEDISAEIKRMRTGK